MMFGHVETLAERIEHLDRVRQLQDETGGFTAFICWTFQPEHTDMADVPPAGSFEYLKTQAVSRLYLDNIPNIQSSWVTQGLKIGQLALTFGANDMGSLMIEENVVAEAGTVHYLTLDQIRAAIEELGYTPRQRNVFYELIDPAQEALAIAANQARAAEIQSRRTNAGAAIIAMPKAHSNGDFHSAVDPTLRRSRRRHGLNQLRVICFPTAGERSRRPA